MERLAASRALRAWIAASTLVAALAPCAGALATGAAGPAPDPHAELAHGSGADHPCHGSGSDAWLAEVCPCGCGSSAPPGSQAGRIGPALLLAAHGLPSPALAPRAPAPEPAYRGPDPHTPDTIPLAG